MSLCLLSVTVEVSASLHVLSSNQSVCPFVCLLFVIFCLSVAGLTQLHAGFAVCLASLHAYNDHWLTHQMLFVTTCQILSKCRCRCY